MAWRQLPVTRVLENALNLLDDEAPRASSKWRSRPMGQRPSMMRLRYDPPVARSGPERVTADYHQVKWHVEVGGRFGYADFIDPAFIGARRSPSCSA